MADSPVIVADPELAPSAGADGVEIDVSIVLPVYNEGPVVQPVLSLLIAQLRGEDEIVVVDDGSTDDTLQQTHEVARLTPDRVRVLHQPRNQGAGAARNRGVREARHEILAFTDAGCTPASGWLEAVRRGFAETPQPDLVAGVYEVTTGSLFEQAVAAGCYPSVREARHPDLHHRLYGRLLGRVFDGTRPAGRSMAVLRSAFDRVGGFRDGRAAAEDIDFARAVVVSGGRWVLSTEANVIWQQRPGWRSTARMYYRYGQGDGLSADAQAVIRNLLRAGAYVVGPAVVQRGSRPIRFVAAAAGLFYLSLPLRRAASGPAAPAVMFMAPAVLILKDLAKAVGCLTGLLRRRYGGYRTTRPSIPSGQEATR